MLYLHCFVSNPIQAVAVVMDNELLCNYKKCRKPLNSQAWVTSCSHIFCYDDGAREFEKAFTCPACHTSLPGNYDIVKVDLNPSDQYKSMILAGQRPEVIFEICSRAVSFWTYQVHQEIMFQKYVSTKAKQNSVKIEKHYQDALQRAKNEINSLNEYHEHTKQDLEAFKKKTAELSEKLTERIRQNQKLQSLYEALKRKCISPSFFERQRVEQKGRPPSFAMSTASEIICPQGGGRTTHRTRSIDYTQIEKEFILKPADDVSIAPQAAFTFPPQEQFHSQDQRDIPPRKKQSQH